DSLADEMKNLQAQVAAGTKDQNAQQAGGQVQKLIESQERLPEEVLDKLIEQTVIRNEARKRGVEVSRADIDAKINEQLSVQRELLNAPTPTPTPTLTPRFTATETREGFVPPPSVTPTVTQDPLTPTLTLDPLTPTVTRTPFPTRLTRT